jgi:DNA polymerase/3'-5' exonuclease PolX
LLSKLPEETQVFLKYKPDRTIPHDDIKRIEPFLLKLQSKNIKLQIVGSYRREKANSKDIDIMLVSNDENAIENFLLSLKKISKNKAYPYSKGKDKMSIIINADAFIDSNKKYKLDIFRVKPENKIPMLLYSTGSKEHNILMRSVAKKKKMRLNQKGLFRIKPDGVLEKINGLKTEKAYFDALGLEYLEPKKRV